MTTGIQAARFRGPPNVNLKLTSELQTWGWSNMITFLKNLVEKGVINEIFFHFRNLSIAALVIAAGWHVEVKGGESQYLWLITTKISGYIVISIGIVLFILNIVDGFYKLSKLKYGAILDTTLIILYIIISFRLAKIFTAFRISF